MSEEAAPVLMEARESESTEDVSGRKFTLQDFDVGRSLGKGKFGIVVVAREKESKFIVALKVFNKRKLQRRRVEFHVKREIEIQYHLRHPNILRLYCFFHDDDRVYTVLEYAKDGALWEMLKSKGGKLEEKVVAKLMAQLMDAVSYCHKRKVIHRDIKPENILLDALGNVKLADFGWSVVSDGTRRDTLCGTADYMSPEMLEHRQHDEKVDHWSCGVLMYECIVGHAPFYNRHRTSTFAAIKAGNFHIPAAVSEGACVLIRGLIQKDPAQRMPFEQALAQPWIVDNIRDYTPTPGPVNTTGPVPREEAVPE